MSSIALSKLDSHGLFDGTRLSWRRVFKCFGFSGEVDASAGDEDTTIKYWAAFLFKTIYNDREGGEPSLKNAAWK